MDSRVVDFVCVCCVVSVLFTLGVAAFSASAAVELAALREAIEIMKVKP